MVVVEDEDVEAVSALLDVQVDAELEADAELELEADDWVTDPCEESEELDWVALAVGAGPELEELEV